MIRDIEVLLLVQGTIIQLKCIYMKSMFVGKSNYHYVYVSLFVCLVCYSSQGIVHRGKYEALLLYPRLPIRHSERVATWQL